MMWISKLALVNRASAQSRAGRVGLPGIERGGRHAHHPAAHCDRQVLAASGDERRSFWEHVLLGEEGAARLRISTSISATRSLRRNSTSFALVGAEALLAAIVDVSDVHPTPQARLGDPEIPGNLRHRLGRLHSMTPELRRMRTRHTDSFPMVPTTSAQVSGRTGDPQDASDPARSTARRRPGHLIRRQSRPNTPPTPALRPVRPAQIDATKSTVLDQRLLTPSSRGMS